MKIRIRAVPVDIDVAIVFEVENLDRVIADVIIDRLRLHTQRIVENRDVDIDL